MKIHARFAAGLLVGCLIATATANNAGDTFGSWHLSRNGDISEAFTFSDTGAMFGLLCSRSKDNCNFYLESPTACDEGSVYPVLANGHTGAAELTGTCHIFGKGTNLLHAIVLSPGKQVGSMAQKTGELGFAVPLVSGQFMVYRFNLDGSSTAINLATSYASYKTGDQQL